MLLLKMFFLMFSWVNSHEFIGKKNLYIFNVNSAKGQLISQGLFVFLNSSKKRTKTFWPSRLGQKLIVSSFFGRIEDTKISFRD